MELNGNMNDISDSGSADRTIDLFELKHVDSVAYDTRDDVVRRTYTHGDTECAWAHRDITVSKVSHQFRVAQSPAGLSMAELRTEIANRVNLQTIGAEGMRKGSCRINKMSNGDFDVLFTMYFAIDGINAEAHRLLGMMNQVLSGRDETIRSLTLRAELAECRELSEREMRVSLEAYANRGIFRIAASRIGAWYMGRKRLLCEWFDNKRRAKHGRYKA